eukprot:424222-Prorocentrum_lima.AAC.1
MDVCKTKPTPVEKGAGLRCGKVRGYPEKNQMYCPRASLCTVEIFVSWIASTLMWWVVIQSSTSSRLANCFPVRMLRVENL